MDVVAAADAAYAFVASGADVDAAYDVVDADDAMLAVDWVVNPSDSIVGEDTGGGPQLNEEEMVRLPVIEDRLTVPPGHYLDVPYRYSQQHSSSVAEERSSDPNR